MDLGCGPRSRASSSAPSGWPGFSPQNGRHRRRRRGGRLPYRSGRLDLSTQSLAGVDLAAADVALRLYQVAEAGLEVYLEWLRKPVVRETAGAELGQHLMRFSLMEHGIAIHRASLEWVGSAMAALGETSSVPGD